MASQTFPKSEKVTNKNTIQALFRRGEQFYNYPLKLFLLTPTHQDSHPPLQVLVSVPKKRFKQAVKRNRLKRQLREVYRLNKSTLLERITVSGKVTKIAIVYVSKKMEPYDVINESYKNLINRLSIEQ